ncbi:11805_t:CDS:2, partial [Funneliformis geosporum]
MGKKPDIMDLVKQDEKIIELLPVGNQFGVVGIQITDITMYLNILVKDLA